MDTCMCLSESLCCSLETITLLLIAYTPYKVKNFFFFFKTSPSNAVREGLIPGSEAKIPHASQPINRNIKQKQYYNKLKDF